VTDAAQILAELRQLRALVEALQPPALRPTDAAVVTALAAVFGSAALTSREIVAALALEVGDRKALREALEAATGGFLSAQAVGHVLRRIADAGGRSGGWRLTATTAERGRRVFVLERSR